MDASLGYEEKLRDIVTFLSMSVSYACARHTPAALCLAARPSTSGPHRSSYRRVLDSNVGEFEEVYRLPISSKGPPRFLRLDNIVNLKRILADDDIMTSFDEPKLKHFIAEYVHPSLEVRPRRWSRS